MWGVIFKLCSVFRSTDAVLYNIGRLVVITTSYNIINDKSIIKLKKSHVPITCKFFKRV